MKFRIDKGSVLVDTMISTIVLLVLHSPARSPECAEHGVVADAGLISAIEVAAERSRY